MEDLMNSPSPELDNAPTIGNEASQDEPDLIEVEGDGVDETDQPTAETEEQVADPDEEEFDWQGRKVRAPKGLKDSLMLQADYTRKTQTLAEERANLEAYRQQVAQQAQVTDVEINARAELTMVNNRLKQFESVNWNQAFDEDFVEAQKARLEFEGLRDHARELQGNIAELGNRRSQAAQQDFAKRVEETTKFAQKNIKDWSPQVDKQILDYAASKGIDNGFLRQHMQPLLYEILHKAAEYEKIIARPAPKPAAAPKPQALETVAAKSNAPVRKSLSQMTVEEHAAYFKKQQAQKGR